MAALVLGETDAVGGVGLLHRGGAASGGGRRYGHDQEADQDSEVEGG